MYEAFDSFLKNPTWHTKHALDEERFFKALAEVVDHDDFHADNLGEYMDEKRANGEASLAMLNEAAYDSARDHYVAAAHAVYGSLRAQRR